MVRENGSPGIPGMQRVRRDFLREIGGGKRGIFGNGNWLLPNKEMKSCATRPPFLSIPTLIVSPNINRVGSRAGRPPVGNLGSPAALILGR